MNLKPLLHTLLPLFLLVSFLHAIDKKTTTWVPIANSGITIFVPFGHTNTPTKSETAITKIATYAQNNTSPTPTLQDYQDAGVTGVNIENLTQINEEIEALTGEEVDTVSEIQDVVHTALQVSDTSVYNLNINNITDHSATIIWEGNPKAKTWLLVHKSDREGSKHDTANHTYTYATLSAGYTFTVYVQGEDSDVIIQKEFTTLNKALVTSYGIYNPANIALAKSRKSDPNYANMYNTIIKQASEYLTSTVRKDTQKKGFVKITDSTTSSLFQEDMARDGGMMHILALAYVLSDESDRNQYAKKAIEILDAYANKNKGIRIAFSNIASDQHLGRKMPSMIETAFLLRDSDIWKKHPSIDEHFTNWLKDSIVPYLAHGYSGGDMSLNDPKRRVQLGNHGGEPLMIGFMANVYLQSGQVEWDNIMAALKYHLEPIELVNVCRANHPNNQAVCNTPEPIGSGKRVTGGIGPMNDGILLSTKFGEVGGVTVNKSDAIFPYEMWRADDSNNYTKLMTTYYSQIFHFIKSHSGDDMWSYKNNLGLSFNDVLKNVFKMRIGGTKEWQASSDNGPSIKSSDWKQIFWIEGTRLDKPEWVQWAKDGKFTLDRTATDWYKMQALFEQ